MSGVNRQGQAHIMSTAIVSPRSSKMGGAFFRTWFSIDPQPASVRQTMNIRSDVIMLRTKIGISKVYFIELPKEVQERFHYGPATPIAAHRQSRPITLEAKQDAPRQANDRGWVGAMMADPATFGRMLKIFVTVAVIITGVVLAIIRARS